MSVSPPVTPAPLAYQPGDVIAGKYALEAVLGSGGMGAVFRARNTVIDMPVAIKLIRADLDREQFSGRLLQEARAAAKLAHPAIVRVFDVGQTDLGDPFIVMELLEGETLSELIEREGRLTGERAVQLLLPIADALSTAHGKGFVHRDVKPDNVFISRSAEGQWQPKLVDFGIVKQEDLGGDPQTQAGIVVGSPDYMSPEQARGEANVDLRSDVWSFCVVIYEAVTGCPPFVADNYNALMRLIVETEPATLSELGVSDDALSAIIARGLRKDPTERWSSLGQLGRALASWLFEQGIGEDACGASLEARWLARSTDSGPRGLSSSIPPRSQSRPGSSPRPLGDLGSAPTLAGSGPVPPHPLSQPSEFAPRASRKRRVLLLGGVLSVCLGILAYAALSPRVRSDGEHAPPLVASAPPTSALSVAPLASEVPAPVPSVPRLAESAPAPEPARPGPRKPRAVSPSPPKPTPAPTSGASDLLAPY